MDKKAIFLFLLIYIGVSCNRKVEPNDSSLYTSIQLPLAQKEQIISLSEITDSIVYVPLETNDQCLIGSIDKLLVTDDHNYIVVDKDIAASVFLFDSNGSFIRKIGNRGEAKNEYLTLEDVTYENDQIYIWDSAQKKVLVYSAKGSFIQHFRFDYTAHSLCCLGKDLFAFCCGYTPNQALYTNGCYPSTLIYDRAKNETTGKLFFDASISPAAYTSVLNNLYQANLYLPLNDTIYKITEGGNITRNYVLAYDEKYLQNKQAYIERSKTGRLSANEAEQAYLKGMYPHLITYFPCDNVHVFFMRMADYLYYGFYYPNTQTYKEASSRNMLPVKNDIDGIGVFSPRCSKGNILYNLVEPSELSEKENCLKKQIAEDNNPIIAKLYMKR